MVFEIRPIWMDCEDGTVRRIDLGRLKAKLRRSGRFTRVFADEPQSIGGGSIGEFYHRVDGRILRGQGRAGGTIFWSDNFNAEVAPAGVDCSSGVGEWDARRIR